MEDEFCGAFMILWNVNNTTLYLLYYIIFQQLPTLDRIVQSVRRAFIQMISAGSILLS
jgi:hypothetical protein